MHYVQQASYAPPTNYAPPANNIPPANYAPPANYVPSAYYVPPASPVYVRQTQAAGAAGAAGAASSAASAAGAASSVAGAAAGPQSALGKLCADAHTSCQKAQDCICASGIGTMLSGMTAPLTMMSGGLVCDPCAAAKKRAEDEAAKAADGSDPDGSGATAAKIKQEKADAKKRKAAVDYLATVDCNYYPEAGIALVKSLRTDKEEIVRLAAARALGTGCCCSEDIIAALKLAVNGGSDDGNPPETSQRVRSAAWRSLQTALKKCGPDQEDGDFKRPVPQEAPVPSVTPASYQPVARAPQVVQPVQHIAPANTASPEKAPRSLADLWDSAGK